MSKIDIISGFLGAGKTTLIQKLIKECFQDKKVVLIENEFGEIGIDGTFLKEAGVQITEMNSGCICCSLVGDFSEALKKVYDQFQPDHIIIEPSGVGKLSDVMKAVSDLHDENLVLNSHICVVDGMKTMVYSKNFGEFFNNQIENASAIFISRSQMMKADALEKVVEKVKELNPNAPVVTTPWDELEGSYVFELMQNKVEDIMTLEELDHPAHGEACCCGHHEHHHHDHEEECCCGHHEHHHHDHEEECCCGHHEHHHHDHEEECCCGHHEHHHHDHEEECCCGHHEHHHHDHEEECCCGHHEHHHHDHEEECCCGHHEHHHHDHECGCGHDHHHHHADEVFNSIGFETVKTFNKEELENILNTLANDETVLRAKGFIKGEGTWFYFDLVPGEFEIREGKPDYTGRICVIGKDVDEAKVKEMFK